MSKKKNPDQDPLYISSTTTTITYCKTRYWFSPCEDYPKTICRNMFSEHNYVFHNYRPTEINYWPDMLLSDKHDNCKTESLE